MSLETVVSRSPVTPSPERQRTSQPTLPYRSEIDGIRAIAVALVVLYHAGIDAAGGGFVGVDVFFVLSGYLITGVLIARSEHRGVALVDFYAGRVRRLLPLSLLTIVTTVAAGIWLLPSTRAVDLIADGRAGVFYVANWRFAGQSVAYADTEVTDGMLIHFWSLSVEEQFYFAWPILIVGSVWLSRRFRRFTLRSSVAAMAAAVTAGSLVASLALTASLGSSAYYATHLRLWEIASGGLLAAAGSRVSVPDRWRTLLGLCALAAIGVAAVRFTDSTPYPGSAALVPVGATLVLLAVGGSSGRLDRVLGSTPMRYLGERSFAIYLWHWPMFGISALLVERYDLGIGDAPRLTLALAVALTLAHLSRSAIEAPVRFSPWLRERTGLTLAGAAIAMAFLPAAAALAERSVTRSTAAVWAAPPPGTAPPAGTATPADTAPPAGTAPTAGSATPAGTAPTARTATPAAISGGLPSSSIPAATNAPMSPTAAIADTASVHFASCNRGLDQDARAREAEFCVAGDPDGTRTVALIGDSHAQQWAPAFDEAGRLNGWRILITTRSACFPYDVNTYNKRLELLDEGCRAWGRAAEAAIIADGDIDLVVVGRARAYVQTVRNEDGSVPDQRGIDEALDAGVSDFLDAVRPATDRVLVLEDTPWAPYNVPDCLAEKTPRTASECDFDAVTTPLEVPLIAAERRAVKTAAGSQHVVSFDDMVCPHDLCAVVNEVGVITFRDQHHITATFSRSLGAQVGERIAAHLD